MQFLLRGRVGVDDRHYGGRVGSSMEVSRPFVHASREWLQWHLSPARGFRRPHAHLHISCRFAAQVLMIQQQPTSASPGDADVDAKSVS